MPGFNPFVERVKVATRLTDKLVNTIVLAAVLAACAFNRIDWRRVTEGDLIGVWRAGYSQSPARVDKSGVETVTLLADHTYQQTYHDGSGYSYESPWHSWYLDQDGLLHLEGGIWFALGVSDAFKAHQGRVEAITLHGKYVTINLSKEIVLVVDDYNAQIGLESLPIAPLDEPGTVLFFRTSTLPPVTPQTEILLSAQPS